jgi:hypothetical protein
MAVGGDCRAHHRTAFTHQSAVADGELEMPADPPEDHLGGELPPLEQPTLTIAVLAPHLVAQILTEGAVRI